jgi:PAS domain S-box-containing protein
MDPAQRARFQAQIAALTPTAPTVSYEMDTVLPDGRRGWERWTDRALFDDAGRLVEMQSVGRDVTERRRAEAALRTSEARLAALMEHAPLIIHLKDREGRYLLANPECAKLFGREPAEVIGKTPFDLLPYETAAEADRVHREVVETGRTLAYEEYDPRVGAYNWTHTIRFSVRDRDGRVAVVGCIALDITERKRAEAALRASEAGWRRSWSTPRSACT